MRSRVRLLALFGAVSFSLSVGCASAPDAEPRSDQVGVDLEAIVGGTPATTYAAAAILNMHAANGSLFGCSAALIAPQVVLTAGHCVDGMVSWDIYVGGSHRTSTHGETYDWSENGASTVNPLHHDIGLVYLDSAITIAAYPTIASAPLPNDSAVADVGRVHGGAVTNDLYVAQVKVTDGNAFGFPHDYSAVDVIEHGDSGGPVFALGTAAQTIVAVNSGAGGGSEVLARTDLLKSWIAGKIAVYSPTAPAPPPSASSSSSPPPPSLDAGAGAPPAACPSESEVNDTFAKANALKGSVCGKLGAANDVDWFTTTIPAGTSAIEITGGDAAFLIGNVGALGCVPALSGVHRVTARATGTVRICLAVSSPTHALASYRVTVTP